MKLLENEQILWESKNKQLLLTTHRLREMNKSIFGNKIKSIMLEEISSCEFRTTRQSRFLRKAILYFFLINGAVYLLNHYLFDAELVKLFFGEIHIGPDTTQIIFYFSIMVAVIYCSMLLFSVKKVFSFCSTCMTIDFQIRWINFEERENFISKVEAAKDERQQQLCVQNRK